MLDGLVEAVHAGESRVLVVHGELGTGKSALLEHLAGQAVGCRSPFHPASLAWLGRRGTGSAG